MDQQPPKPDDERDEAPEEPRGDAGILGEIEGGEPQEETPEAEGRRPRRRRSRMIGCLLAVLGALAGGGLALWISRGAILDTPADDEQVVAPAEEAVELPANRLVFSPTPERPDQTPDIISAETDVIYCFYDMGRLPADAPLSGSWSLEGEPLGELALDQHQRDEDADHARGRFVIYPPTEPEAESGAARDAAETAPDAPSGFPPGIYEVELTSPEYPEVTAVASFVAVPRAAQVLQGGGEPEGPPVIRSLEIATGVTEAGEPVGQSTTFPVDVDRITAVFSYRGITPGAVLTVRWYAGDLELTRARTEVAVTAAEGWAEAWLEVGGDDTLPPGEYRVSVHLGDEDEPLARTGFELVPPHDAPSPAPSS